MSDFFNSGWSLYVAGITIVSLVFCLVLLIIASRRKVMADDNTTGHVWDEDLRELNNPLPRWWAGLFLVTVAFAVIYLVLYPGLGSHKGSLQWTSTGQHSTEMEKAREQMAPLYAKFVDQPAEVLAKDPQAMAIGERLFANNCAQCHGSDARGSKGFPNLTDNDWLHGGTLDKIKETITLGRVGNMPPMAAAVGTPEDVKNVAQYVLSLSGSPHNEVAAQQGKAKFAVCAACHGPDGKGMQAVGSANLTDKIWLHGYGEQAIVDMVVNGKVNIMPAQASRLSPEQIHVLGAYVWSLSQTSTVATR
ncbi:MULTISPECIES: cytochrome-c oxidase, cbb3-type subunit III [Rubrivivax]|uniref:Cbb3-type cytochrome c oxidase subunit n=1 Tax=Rubrivivax benzoatilyticus TaxID=316997 RepID=A0ABX0I1G9_9BURK|nr:MULTISPECIES: cytochrome-c oxidase, cbb3-type subunit III [Rubrivivax]EGJ10725.1 cytochrome c oxidase, cbb3-type subunit III [Rubrivivax benzoatilyticus JA2 = ATCC BAA-35]MCC9597911.1 cytochrome-c oxidase, cbb3-type subunit III [Rubrivivax sp. JA1055]MCC9645832.1 cytochrome-c oxidase, cbb3-type subunit III [Rubrivivax sp. JA1029]NHK99658.1 cytochrome-c oxidase, cbb3-type subunit III [Rubrivivax benzoatilyticus]NHL25531.1 cytochrome-c oxidase, cbb3-type subunit III [Rubrivivax benzoatilyticu